MFPTATFNDYSLADGIKVYTPVGLRLYDPLIVGLLASHVWHCGAADFIGHYRRYVTSNHADIGVGTGYCLDRCEFPAPPRIALIDLQPHCLAFASKRLRRYRPEVYLHDVHEPLHGVRPFDSVALGGLLHCLPGDMQRKANAFDVLRSIGKPGTRVFGFTLVADAISALRARRWASRALHRLRVVNFHNDSAAALLDALTARFASPRMHMVGAFAFFSAVWEG